MSRASAAYGLIILALCAVMIGGTFVQKWALDAAAAAPRIADVCLEKKTEGTRMGFNGKVLVRLPKEVCVRSEKQCVVADDYDGDRTCADAWREAGAAETTPRP